VVFDEQRPGGHGWGKGDFMMDETERALHCCVCPDCVGYEVIKKEPLQIQIACTSERCFYDGFQIDESVDNGALSLRALLAAGSGVTVKGYDH
jgi:hypothetical protein